VCWSSEFFRERPDGEEDVLNNTQQLMVGLIEAAQLKVADADAIKSNWETNHRFAMPGFQSFAELLTP
jgi:hypothetical protein